MTLPKLSEVDPALLTTIGASAMHALNAGRTPTIRELPPAARREYDRKQHAAWRKKKLAGKAR